MPVDDGLDYYDAFAEHRNVVSLPILVGDRSRKPLITIAIPTFRRPQLLREAVASALAQDATFCYEVIVVDNAPASATAEQFLELTGGVPDARLHYFRNSENIGMFGNWNRCLELARGEWVTILNDDDWLAPSFLSETMAVLDRRSDIDLLAVRFEVRDERSSKLPPGRIARLAGGAVGAALRALRRVRYPRRVQRLRLIDYYYANPHVGSLGLLFRRRIGIALGGFRQELYPTADNWFFVRIASAGRSWVLNRSLAFYRVQENESAKPEVLRAFVDHGLAMRATLNARYFGKSSILHAYSWILAKYQGRCLVHFWGGHQERARRARSILLMKIAFRAFVVCIKGCWRLRSLATGLPSRRRLMAPGPDAASEGGELQHRVGAPLAKRGDYK